MLFTTEEVQNRWCGSNVWMHKSSSLENNSCPLAWRLYRLSGCVSWSLVTTGKRSHEMGRVKFWHTNKYGGGVRMSVSEKEVKSQTVYLYQCSARSPGSNRLKKKRETVQPTGARVYRRDNICVRVSESVKHAGEWTHACVSPDLMLRGQLLHVSVKTPEARQEVIDHHLLRNDCTGS